MEYALQKTGSRFQSEGDNMKKWKIVGFTALTLICIGVMLLFEIKKWPAGSGIAGAFLGLTLPVLIHAIQDLFDTTDWKVSQRKLLRGNFITDSTIVRVSFAYLFRIKVGDKYLLVRNNRGTEKFQPVGGVYKLRGREKNELKKLYTVMDDNKIPIDESSRDDYRLRMENKYLRKFVKRFDGKARRERIDNLGREFKEELIETGLVNWSKIKYRVCGRHLTELRFGEHFQIYELLLADVVELLPTAEQEKDLRGLMRCPSDMYYFATAEEIKSLGIDIAAGKYKEIIGDHTLKTLQENEGKLLKIPGAKEMYTVNFD